MVDDGSTTDDFARVVDELADRLQVTGVRIAHSGRSAAKNHTVLLARAPVVLFFDDDDRAAPDYLERHLAGHDGPPGRGGGHPRSHRLGPGARAHPAHALHHRRRPPDVRLRAPRRRPAARLARVLGGPDLVQARAADAPRAARPAPRRTRSTSRWAGGSGPPDCASSTTRRRAASWPARSTSTRSACAPRPRVGRTRSSPRCTAAPRSPGASTSLDAAKLWDEERAERAAAAPAGARARGAVPSDRPPLAGRLHAAYRQMFRLLHAKGAASTGEEPRDDGQHHRPRCSRSRTPIPDLVYDGTPADRRQEPLLSITLPVWSRTPRARGAWRRARSSASGRSRRSPPRSSSSTTARPIEVPHRGEGLPLPREQGGRHRVEHRGAARQRARWSSCSTATAASSPDGTSRSTRPRPTGGGWRSRTPITATGSASRVRTRAAPRAGASCSPRRCTTRSACSTSGSTRRSARTRTTGTAPGRWASSSHRCRAARVVHARRTTASTDPRVDMLLQGHRYKYGWKHGVDPHRAPPYYNRDIVDYEGSFRLTRRSPRRPSGPAARLRHRSEQDGHHLVARRADDAGLREPALGRARRCGSFVEVVARRRRAAPVTPRRRASTRSPTSRCSRRTSSCSTASTRAAGSSSPSGRSRTGSTADAGTWRTTSAARRTASTTAAFVDVGRAGLARGVAASTWTGSATYFAGRDDFLEIDLAEGAGWASLCALLDAPVPDQPFPWRNRGAADGPGRSGR